jgi:hypothetical protein
MIMLNVSFMYIKIQIGPKLTNNRYPTTFSVNSKQKKFTENSSVHLEMMCKGSEAFCVFISCNLCKDLIMKHF